MNNKLKAILKGVATGAKETPREFFAPIIAFATVMHRATEEVRSGPQSERDHVHLAARAKGRPHREKKGDRDKGAL